jgi:hypothetical protein
MFHLSLSHCLKEDLVLHQVDLADSRGDYARWFEQLDQPNTLWQRLDQHDIIHYFLVI